MLRHEEDMELEAELETCCRAALGAVRSATSGQQEMEYTVR